MLDQLIALAFRADAARDVVQRELARLIEAGYLQAEDGESLLETLREQLEAGAGRGARELSSTALPLAREAGRVLREVLDIPSRSEIQALREALERAHPPADSGPDASADSGPDEGAD